MREVPFLYNIKKVTYTLKKRQDFESHAHKFSPKKKKKPAVIMHFEINDLVY